MRAQLLAAGTAATGVIVLYDGHLLSTSSFDLLTWTLASWLVVRAVLSGQERWWLIAGVVLGVGLLNKPLPAFLMLGWGLGLLIAGPRQLLRARAVWAAAIIAVVVWAPWLLWQSNHGWPQLEVSRSVASGASASSQPWWAIVPFTSLAAGSATGGGVGGSLISLLRSQQLMLVRFFAWAWLTLAVVFMASGGKPYYLAGLLPVLTAAGALVTDGWLARGRAHARTVVLTCVLAVSAAVGAVIALPVLPADDAGPVIAANADVGETVGWPQLVTTIASVRDRLRVHGPVVIFTHNYGEAGAVDRYGPAMGLPRAYSRHNAYSSWGPPPDRRAAVIVVGLSTGDIRAFFRGCRVAARVQKRANVDNEEHGEAIEVCRGPRRPWSAQWRALRHFN